MLRFHFSTPEKFSPVDVYGCHAHAKSEHVEPRRYPIRRVFSAGVTSAALHAREYAIMPPRERHGRLSLIGKAGISREKYSSSAINALQTIGVCPDSFLSPRSPPLRIHCPLATDYCSHASRPTPHASLSSFWAMCRPPGVRQPMGDVADVLRRLVLNRAGNRCEYCRSSQE